MDQQDKNTQEIWESTTGGTTYLHVKDPRNPNGWVQKKVGGRGTQRITVTVEEREFNQDLVTYENTSHDPFTNGLLVRISPKDVERGQFEVTDDELVTLLKADGDEVFEKLVNDVTSEVVLRRLLDLAKRHASMYRYELIDGVIAQRYSIGKTQKVVKEMIEDDARYAGADL